MDKDINISRGPTDKRTHRRRWHDIYCLTICTYCLYLVYVREQLLGFGQAQRHVWRVEVFHVVRAVPVFYHPATADNNSGKLGFVSACVRASNSAKE